MPGDTLEGVSILEEVEGDRGVALWQLLRDVTLWAEVEPEHRTGLFRAGASERIRSRLGGADSAAPVNVALQVLLAMVAAPQSATGETLALSCLQVTRVLADEGALRTAAEFAQAAAVADDASGEAAVEAGAYARRLGRAVSAELWFRRAIALARRRGQRPAYARACNELAQLAEDQGDLDRARTFRVRAYRAARRWAVRDERGAALEGLARLALRRGSLDDALRHARSAKRTYGRAHPRTGAVLLALGEIHLRREDYPDALQALQAALERDLELEEEIVGWSLLSHAAAGAGDQSLLEEAWDRTHHLLNEVDRSAGIHALMRLVRAASLAEHPQRVEAAARRALELSTRSLEPMLAGP